MEQTGRDEVRGKGVCVCGKEGGNHDNHPESDTDSTPLT